MANYLNTNTNTNVNNCTWSFLRYEASEFEQKWMAMVKKNPTGHLMCEELHSPSHSAETYDLARATREFAARQTPDQSKFHYFSRMIYKYSCQNGISKV